MEFNRLEISENWHQRLVEGLYSLWVDGNSIADIAQRYNIQEYVVENILREVVNGNK